MDQPVTFKNSKGDKLAGIINLSDGADLKSPVVVICHGFSSSKNGSAHKVANMLNEIGIGTLRFDFWGHGESDGTFEDITLSEGVDDTLSAINFLSVRGHTNISLLGTSYGGACAIMAASKTDKLKVLGLRSPVADYGERTRITMSQELQDDWVKKGYRIYTSSDGRELKLKSSFFLDFENNKGFEAAQKIRIPTCVVHGDKDESVPLELSKKLAGIIPGLELHIIPGADHRYTDKKLDDQAIGILVQFFKEQLGK